MIIYLNFLKEIITIYNNCLDFFFVKIIKNVLIGLTMKKDEVKQLA